MSKRIKILLAITLALILIVEVFWYNQYEGNVVTFFQSELSQEHESVDLIINTGERILVDTTLNFSPLDLYGGFSNTVFGIKTLGIKSKKLNIEIERKFFFFPVTWVVVNVSENQLQIKTHFIPPLLQ